MSDAGSEPQPFELGPGAGKQHAPATLRNREPIAAMLVELLPKTGTVLEIASGTGEHVVHFARCFPDLTWQPTDVSADALRSIAAWRDDTGLDNILPPHQLDLTSGVWPAIKVDAIFCANMTHIAPWAATVGLFEGARQILKRDGALILYGPFFERDVGTAPSNLSFDLSLRARDPNWGLRDLAQVDKLAVEHGMRRTRRISMPANNLMLVYQAS
ncbi:DUF938 domain-containing protein [Croceicoccus ponticola]|uniref:DUF938 domain-containing protein n=2 Tax=Croceicoccus ponticola TaxID=2217664 RepID=A0A437GV23_9SPHN|nr:DUF938 domain-containing protein [Croceicoccus ponticola]RVQ65472.1 DUF938 domain-containing protein [Croceicoccus ponticola]